ncbi:eotaxin-like [Archocentrus centrarchus]|uniref:eotaxin-like n=1 Tax=Archocentrus centrarchus TaxID=63155 RepID=UPI0011E9ED58|nr:eotaxin-like [Archocentrus centrarchus]
MSVKILSITLLLLSVCLCFHAAAARRNPSRSRLCCIGVTSINKSSEVLGETYRGQSEKSPCVKAIIFNTDDGKLCADPKAQWVKELIATMMKV